jgi:DNA-binding NarL/FixJ family response regulator
MDAKPKQFKVIVVDDDTETLDLLSTIINKDPELEVLDTYTTAEEAIDGILRHQPHLVVMDISLPGMSGVAAIVRIKVALPRVQFLMYTSFEDKRLADSIIAGASGYILKEKSSYKIVPALKEIIAGNIELNPHISRMAAEYFTRKKENYTVEEIKLMKYLSGGLSNIEIADLENTTEGAIKQKLFKLFKKAHVRCRAEMVSLYLSDMEE